MKLNLDYLIIFISSDMSMIDYVLTRNITCWILYLLKSLVKNWFLVKCSWTRCKNEESITFESKCMLNFDSTFILQNFLYSVSFLTFETKFTLFLIFANILIDFVYFRIYNIFHKCKNYFFVRFSKNKNIHIIVLPPLFIFQQIILLNVCAI